jgi:capsular polysaccharide export protein
MPKRFLLLQGVSSPFFARLGERLRAAGHRVFKVNFNCGDAAYWFPRAAWRFRGEVSALPEWLSAKFESHGFTDVVLFGDRRPVHVSAIACARKFGAKVHVFEEGYFRPNWVTLERGGVNRYSALPRDPAWYLNVTPRIPERAHQRIHTPLAIRAGHDIAYHLANTGNFICYPGYRTHRPFNAVVEYAGLARRFALLGFYERKDKIICDQLVNRKAPFFLLPLQLDSDAQIREFSAFSGMSEVIEMVVRSFSRAAPGEANLLIKNHPLDTGFVDYSRLIDRIAKDCGVESRVHFIETGDANALLQHANGVVLVNSTVGTAALEAGRPVKTLADPIYNLPGLTFQGELDDFWKSAVPPDAELMAAFRKVVMHTTLVNGGFYTRESMAMAAAGAIQLLTADKSPIEELL